MNPWLVLGSIFVLPGLVGPLVYIASPRRTQNRALGLSLVGLGATGVVASAAGAVGSPASYYAARFSWLLASFVHATGYMVFLGTIPSPWARLTAGRRARVGLIATAAAAGMSLLIWPHLWVEGVATTVRDIPLFGVEEGWIYRLGPVGLVYTAILINAMFVYGIVVALSAWWRAATPEMRRQMAVYASAFVLLDAALLLLWTSNGLARLEIVSEFPTWWNQLTIVLLVVANVVSPVLLAYGMLRYQLFDLDLRIKFAISRTTLVAFFVAAFFIVSESTAQLLGDRTGSTFLGILAAGALLFFLAPLQRLADRFSDRTLPGVSGTHEYIRVRKHEVYRAAVEGALQDGNLSDNERAMLARLADELELSSTEALDLERNVAAAISAARTP